MTTPFPQSTSPGRAGEARSERLELVRARRSSVAGLILLVALLVGGVIERGGESYTCVVLDAPSTCEVVGR